MVYGIEEGVISESVTEQADAMAELLRERKQLRNTAMLLKSIQHEHRSSPETAWGMSFAEYAAETYGIGIRYVDSCIAGRYNILDDDKYLLALLKFS